MNDLLYEITVEKNHLNNSIKALSNDMCEQYGSKREVVVASPIPDDINLWNNAVKAVVERHKDELQSLADK